MQEVENPAKEIKWWKKSRNGGIVKMLQIKSEVSGEICEKEGY